MKMKKMRDFKQKTIGLTLMLVFILSTINNTENKSIITAQKFTLNSTDNRT